MDLIQVSALLVIDHLANGHLLRVLPDIGEVRWPMSIMYPNRQYLAPQVRIFIDWMARLVEARRSSWLHPI